MGTLKFIVKRVSEIIGLLLINDAGDELVVNDAGDKLII